MPSSRFEFSLKRPNSVSIFFIVFFQFDMNAIPKDLETLNLHKNYITELQPSEMEKRLLYLDLSGNNIASLNPRMFVYLPNLKLLTLSNNMLTSLDFYKFLPTSLHKLDLRVNLIESLEEENGEMVNFGHLHKMEDIYISQNLWICSCNFEHLLK